LVSCTWNIKGKDKADGVTTMAEEEISRSSVCAGSVEGTVSGKMGHRSCSGDGGSGVSSSGYVKNPNTYLSSGRSGEWIPGGKSC
jgi:hypothetical protein